MTALTEETRIDADSAAETPVRRILADFLASKLAIAGLAALAGIIFVALFAPWISPQNPYDLAALDLLDGRLPPGTASADGGITYWLGTDDQGRDMMSAIFYGLRTRLMVGVLSAGFPLVIGTTLGLTAAYVGGRAESLIMRLVDLQLSFPAILVALILLALLGHGVAKIILPLVVVQWAYFARTSRPRAAARSRTPASYGIICCRTACRL